MISQRPAVGPDAVVGVMRELDAEEDGANDDEDDANRVRRGVEHLVEHAVAREHELELRRLDELQLLAHVEREHVHREI